MAQTNTVTANKRLIHPRFADTTAANSGGAKQAGNVIYLTTKDSLAYRNNANTKWTIVSGGSGADSTTFQTKFRTDTMRTRVDSTLARKANQENHLGVIYNQNSWTSGTLASDFTQSGGITASVVANKIQVSGGAGTYTQVLKLNGGTYLEHWQMAMKVKIGTITGTSYGYGIGVTTSNNYVATTSTIARAAFASSSANINFATNASGSFANVFVTSQTVSQTANDYLLITYRVDIPNTYISIRNMTTGATQVDTVATGYWGGNTSNFTIYSLGGTFTIDSLAVTSTELKYGSDLFIGDSKTQGGYLSNPNKRFVSLLGLFSKSVVNVGAGGDRTSDILNRITQIISLKPKRVFLAIGSNDIRSGVSAATLQANYASIANQLKASGAAVYHLLPFYETSVSQTTQRAWLISTFSADSIIDTYTPMTVGGRLNADNVHPNELGHAAIAEAIIQSGKISDVRFVAPYRYGAISRSSDSIYQEVNGLTTLMYKDTCGYVAKTATYTAAQSDNTIDATSGTFTITLPTAVGIKGKIYTIKNSGAGVITVGTTSSQTIDGSTTYSLATQYKYVTIQSNNANWIVTANN